MDQNSVVKHGIKVVVVLNFDLSVLHRDEHLHIHVEFRAQLLQLRHALSESGGEENKEDEEGVCACVCVSVCMSVCLCVCLCLCMSVCMQQMIPGKCSEVKAACLPCKLARGFASHHQRILNGRNECRLLLAAFGQKRLRLCNFF